MGAVFVMGHYTLYNRAGETMRDDRDGTIRYALVIFDMDGTLTHDVLDFERLRCELGMAARQPILEWISGLPETQRKKAGAILENAEMDAAEKAPLRAGVHATLAALRRRGVRTALLSRNNDQCVRTILRRHRLAFDAVVSRDQPPIKPHPESIWGITRRLGVPPKRALMVGDYLFDLQAANAAGVDGVLLLKPQTPAPSFASQAAFVISSLPQLVDLLTVPEQFAPGQDSTGNLPETRPAEESTRLPDR